MHRTATSVVELIGAVGRVRLLDSSKVQRPNAAGTNPLTSTKYRNDHPAVSSHRDARHSEHVRPVRTEPLSPHGAPPASFRGDAPPL
jgi:hypothetical protein